MEELILRERELKENMVQAINNSNLPAFIIRPILNELLDKIVLLEQQQYEQALKVKEQKEQEAKNEKESI